MAIVLKVDEMLTALWTFKDNGGLGAAEYEHLEAQAVLAASNLADKLVELTGVTLTDVSFEMGMLAGSFLAGPNGEKSPIMAEGDEGGDWGDD